MTNSGRKSLKMEVTKTSYSVLFDYIPRIRLDSESWLGVHQKVFQVESPIPGDMNPNRLPVINLSNKQIKPK